MVPGRPPAPSRAAPAPVGPAPPRPEPRPLGCGVNPERQISHGAREPVVAGSHRAGALPGAGDAAPLSPSFPVSGEPRGGALRPPPRARPQKWVRIRLSMLAGSRPRRAPRWTQPGLRSGRAGAAQVRGPGAGAWYPAGPRAGVGGVGLGHK